MTVLKVERPLPSPWRLLSMRPAEGARHMALDQALLEAAGADGFRPTLRFYRWSPPAISIGRFQPLDDIDLEACSAAGIDVVRRPTGGKSILHLDDFTYSVVMPRGFPLPEGVVEAYRRICGGIIRALAHIGVEAAVLPGGENYRHGGGACFAVSTQADLEYSGRKICGSAQVRRGGALLQHGSILLEDRSELLHGLLRFSRERERLECLRLYRERCVALSATGRRAAWTDLSRSFLLGFEETFGVVVEEGALSSEERERWKALSGAYASERWLRNADARALPD